MRAPLTGFQQGVTDGIETLVGAAGDHSQLILALYRDAHHQIPLGDPLHGVVDLTEGGDDGVGDAPAQQPHQQDHDGGGGPHLHVLGPDGLLNILQQHAGTEDPAPGLIAGYHGELVGGFTRWACPDILQGALFAPFGDIHHLIPELPGGGGASFTHLLADQFGTDRVNHHGAVLVDDE